MRLAPRGQMSLTYEVKEQTSYVKEHLLVGADQGALRFSYLRVSSRVPVC
jgi:hypothetical protein